MNTSIYIKTAASIYVLVFKRKWNSKAESFIKNQWHQKIVFGRDIICGIYSIWPKVCGQKSFEPLVPQVAHDRDTML